MYNRDLIPGIPVRLYGVCIAIGIVVCILLLRWLGKKQKISPGFLDFTEMAAYIAVIVGFLSAYYFQKIYNVIGGAKWYWEIEKLIRYIKTKENLFDNEGITFLGGLIGGATAFLIAYTARKKSLDGRLAEIVPIAPICITAAHGFGRIGCFFAGCCGGVITKEHAFLSVLFPQEAILSGWRYPTQLLEAAFLLDLTVVMIVLLLKKNFKYNFVIYLSGYGIWRFLIEFIRDKEPLGEFIPGLTPSQFWSLLMVVLSVPVFFIIRKSTAPDGKKREKNKLKRGRHEYQS